MIGLRAGNSLDGGGAGGAAIVGLGAEQQGNGIREIEGMDLRAGPVFLFGEIGEDCRRRLLQRLARCGLERPKVGMGPFGELCHDIKSIEDKDRIVERGRTRQFLGE